MTYLLSSISRRHELSGASSSDKRGPRKRIANAGNRKNKSGTIILRGSEAAKDSKSR